MLFYKVDCGGGGGGGGSRSIPDIPDTTIGIEVDYRKYTIEKWVSMGIISDAIKESNNIYGKKEIKEYGENNNLENVIPSVLRYTTEENYDTINRKTIRLLIQNYTYRDTWLLKGDSWCLYVLIADSLYNVATRRYAAGITFCVKEEYWAPLSIVAGGYIYALYQNNMKVDYLKAVALAHEIGHVFDPQDTTHCDWWLCIMYPYLQPHTYQFFCDNCKQRFRDYYLPKRYGSNHP